MNHLTKKLMAWIWLPLAAAATLSSCDMMTEDRDDCPTGLYLTFKYDYNLQRADMFGDHVGAVDVYVFDKDGKYVKTLSEANAGPVRPLASPTYAMHANLAKEHRATVLAINDDEAIKAAYELTLLEGIIPALESAHALGALEKINFKPTDIVVLTVSGRGDKDIETYLKYKGC